MWTVKHEFRDAVIRLKCGPLLEKTPTTFEESLCGEPAALLLQPSRGVSLRRTTSSASNDTFNPFIQTWSGCYTHTHTHKNVCVCVSVLASSCASRRCNVFAAHGLPAVFKSEDKKIKNKLKSWTKRVKGRWETAVDVFIPKKTRDIFTRFLLLF